MSLAPGSRIGAYDVVAQLGAGGMGEVYRARDAKLQRDVALKVLIAAVADDPDRLARFSREAQVLAALNHPNIASIYGLEDGAIVMELVEGPTLADRLREGALPWDEVLPAAKQICDALGAAHESGIIHRDLKPANIKLRADGTVKVLDFGLAKALEPAGSGANVSLSPTLSVHATQQGVILGTAAYMAPEQARGRTVDRRADIWAFGVVLFEMITGRRAFEGDDVSITLAAVLKDHVDWTALPADLPPPVRRLLRRCLEKDPRRRLSAIGDARLELEDAAAPPDDLPSAHVVTVVVRRPRMPWAVATIATLLAIGMLGVWRPWRAPAEPPRMVFEIPPPATDAAAGWGTPVLLSPDGRHLLTRAGEAGSAKLWVRALDRRDGAAIPGTEGALGSAFWSADGRHVGFFDGANLKRVDLLGSSPQSLADARDGLGGTWSREGVILYAPVQSGPLYRVADTGGTPIQVTELNQSRAELTHRYPIFLPDGNHFLYFVVSSQSEKTGIYLGSLDRKEATLIVASSHRPEFAPPDVLLFVRGGMLMAQRLDVSRAQLMGEPIQIADQINANPALGSASMSVTATALAYLPGSMRGSRRLLWKNADDKPGEPIGGLALFDNPRLSPDGTRLAVAIADGTQDVWVYDLERGTNTRFTFDKATDNVPIWSPDGSRIAFISNRDGGVFNIYQRNAGGTGEDELLLKTPANKALNDWSTDGRFLLYTENDPKTGSDLWALPLVGDRKPIRVLATSFNERQGSFSPDGKWIAYASDEGGMPQVFVQTFPPSAGSKWLLSTARGAAPRWHPDGKQIFYDRTGQMTAVDVLALANGQFKAGVPRPLFNGLQNLGPHNYDVAADGRRFVIVAGPSAGPGGPSPITVVVNWKSALQ